MTGNALPGPSSPGEITRLLDHWTDGRPEALDELFPLVYEELRRLADSYLRRERSDHTLPATALVHEAYLRLSRSQPRDLRVETRRHFFATAAQAMRRILVDHARRHTAARRPSAEERVAWDDADTLESLRRDPLLEILWVQEGLDALRARHPRKAEVVELRFFGGLSESEVAELLGTSRASVARDWRAARLLLARGLGAPPTSEPGS